MTDPRPALRGQYILNTDGGMAPGHGKRRVGDPLGEAAIGVLLRTPRLATLAEVSKAIGPATHNVAEYKALITGLQLALDHGVRRIRVYMDSELVVEQVNDRSTVKQPHLQELRDTVAGLWEQFQSIRVSWVPREMNGDADRLAREALTPRS